MEKKSSSILLGSKAASEYLGIPYEMLRRHGDELGVPFRMVGKRRIYIKGALDRWANGADIVKPETVETEETEVTIP